MFCNILTIFDSVDKLVYFQARFNLQNVNLQKQLHTIFAKIVKKY